MKADVHPTAIISDTAVIGEGVKIGPYAIVGDRVQVGPGTIIGPHSHLEGPTVIGEGNEIGSHVRLGAPPQDKSYKGEDTFLVIGDRNFFGDYVQVCRGTSKTPDKTTRVGSDNYIMSYSHVAHDCILANHITIASYVALAGHVEIEDRVYIGGIVAIHQFVRIGTFCMVAGGSATGLDLPPYVRVAGYGCNVYGLNRVGLRRSGLYDEQQLKNIRAAYDMFFRQGSTTTEQIAAMRAAFPDDPAIEHFCTFVEKSKRGVVRVRRSKTRGTVDSD